MANPQTVVEWRVIGETVPGATHLRAGIPNQDSILYLRESSRELPVILSMSDGHGSPKCFRSDRGSRFAVKKIVYLLGEFLDERRGKFDAAEIESQKGFLATEFVKRWREAVEADLRKEPFQPFEFEILEKKSDAKARKLVEDNPLLAYGATSVTVVVTSDFAIYFQLGDGDVLNVSETGEVTKPLTEDARLLANETTSLCLPKADQDFRFVIQKITAENAPAMILLSTDGYLNSFSSEVGFFQAATDILTMLRDEKGFDTVGENLKPWLEEATRLGSGDDCTVGIIYRPNKIQKSEAKTQTVETAATTTQTAATNRATPPQDSPKSQPLDQPDDPPENQVDGQPEDPDDVTVTITIKKDKNKISASPAVTVNKATDAAKKTGDKTADAARNKKPE